MHSTMQEWPLSIPSIIEHAGRYHAATEIVSRDAEGALRRSSYGVVAARARRAARALLALGVSPGERVATLAWNSERHFELYFAIPGIGAICHTVNPRLSPDQLAYIFNHAEDRIVFLDPGLIPLMESLAPRLKTVRRFVLLAEAATPRSVPAEVLCYEDLIAAAGEDFAWPRLDETTAAGLCYTSGTTGEPKGVLYSHRSSVLHALAIGAADGLGIAAKETILTMVPMFHANAWGIPHAAAMCGARQVFPGPRLDGASLYELIEAEGVTYAAGVPTVWKGLLDHARAAGRRFSSLRLALVGGAAAPRAIIVALEQEFGVNMMHGWGMTEISPVGSTPALKPAHAALGPEERIEKKLHQGRAFYGCELKLVDEAGREVARDGRARGHLKVRGPWVARGYFKAAGDALDAEGWFDTGDIATLDADGYIGIVDRAKDLVKSGGEWISSIALENLASGHPAVAEAAVIAVPDEKWGERPLLVVVAAPGAALSAAEILDFMRPHLAAWQVPDRVLFVESLPHTATGKISKKALRAAVADRPPAAAGDAGA